MIGTAWELLFIMGDTSHPTIPNSRANGRYNLACCFSDWLIPISAVGIEMASKSPYHK